MAFNLLKDHRISLPIKKQILAVTITYMEKEMEKYRNNPELCPKDMPKELCQTPPTFYVWTRKLRDKMIMEEINKSNCHFLAILLFFLNYFYSLGAKMMFFSLIKMVGRKQSNQ